MNSHSPTALDIEVEGLRAIAILAVVGYHARVPGFTGGFAGVDVFFVISGYLITGQIVRLRDVSKFDLIGFWTARLLRLAPTGILVALLTYGVGRVLLPPDRVEQLVDAVWPSLTYTVNLHFIAQSTDYQTAIASLNPLLHMWSLAVEVQFYLVWSFLVLIIPARIRLAVMVGLAVISLTFSVYLTPKFVPFAYYSLPTRLWELAAGGIFAMLSIPVFKFVALIGFAMIFAAVIVFDSSTSFPGHVALLPVVGAMMVMAGAAPFLGHPLWVWIGARSYGWYLWHWPAIVFAELFVHGSGVAAAAVALALAAVTYRYIEKPIRAWRKRWDVT